MNRKPCPPGKLNLEKSLALASNRGNMMDLFRSKDKSRPWSQAKLTLMLGCLWFLSGSLYYVTILISTELLYCCAEICKLGYEKDQGQKDIAACRWIIYL